MLHLYCRIDVLGCDCCKKLCEKKKSGEGGVTLLSNTSEVNNHATNTSIEGNEIQIQNYNVLVSSTSTKLIKEACEVIVDENTSFEKNE